MKRTFVLLSTCALVIGCTESSQSSEPIEVVVDTFNVALAGAFIPYESERRQPIVEAIAASGSDVVCLQEVWNQADKELIRDGALDAYPYSVFFRDDLDTVVDSPTDQQGQVPPAPTGVPCPDEQASDTMNIQAQMNQAVDCVMANCSTTPDATPPEDELGRTTSADCASGSCVGQVAGLLFGDSAQQRCYACVVTQLPTSTFGRIRESCANVVNQDLAFDGQNGVMILSRHPLKNAENWVIPGTWNRRTILSATVELPNGTELDTYCNHLTPIFDVQPINTFPYTGQYGDGMTGAAGWQAEQELQAEKLIDHVAETSGNRPAVIMGDLNAGRAYPEEEIIAEGEATLDLLELAFTPAYAADYAPLCTFCSTNPVAESESSVWIDHILLYNIAAESVTSTARIYDEDVVPVDGMTVPLSDHFGIRSVLVVP